MFKRTCDWKFSDRTRDLVLREDVDTTEQLPEIPEGAIWQYVYDGEENMRIFIKQDRTPASKLPPVDPRLATMYYKPSHSKISFIRRWQLWRDQYLRKLQQRRIGAELQADIHQGKKPTNIDIELKWPSKLPQKPNHLDQEEWEDRQKKSSLSYFMVNDNTKIADLPKLPHESHVHYKDVSPCSLSMASEAAAVGLRVPGPASPALCRGQGLRRTWGSAQGLRIFHVAAPPKRRGP